MEKEFKTYFLRSIEKYHFIICVIVGANGWEDTGVIEFINEEQTIYNKGNNQANRESYAKYSQYVTKLGNPATEDKSFVEVEFDSIEPTMQLRIEKAITDLMG